MSELAAVDNTVILTALISAILGGGLLQGIAKFRQMPADRSVQWVTAQDVVIENLGHELTRRDEQIAALRDENRELRSVVRDLRRRVHDLEVRLDEEGPESYV